MAHIKASGRKDGEKNMWAFKENDKLILGEMLVGIRGMHKLRIKHKRKAHCYLTWTLICFHLSRNSN